MFASTRVTSTPKNSLYARCDTMRTLAAGSFRHKRRLTPGASSFDATVKRGCRAPNWPAPFFGEDYMTSDQLTPALPLPLVGEVATPPLMVTHVLEHLFCPRFTYFE